MTLVDPTGGIGYAFGEVLSSADMTSVTGQLPDAVDGTGGGTYAGAIILSALTAIFTGELGLATITTVVENTGTQRDNYSPGSTWTTCQVAVIEAAVAFSVTGFAARTSGKLKIVLNTGAFPITVKDQDAGSTAGNRVMNLGSANLNISADGGIGILWYSDAESRWRLLLRS